MLSAIIKFVFWAIFFIKIFLEFTSARCKSYKCLNGKTALVTGGNSGIGTEICMTLASRGCKIIIADVADCSELVAKIIKKTGNEDITYKNLDLASFASVRKFCSEIIESEDHLDILIHNAACMSFNKKRTEDSLLRVMQVNHFGNFLLTNLLAGLLQKTPKSRLVFVSTVMVYFNKVNIRELDASPDVESDFTHSIVEYANSKFCNLVVCNEFARRLKGVTCNAVNPGEFYSPIVESLNKYSGSNSSKSKEKRNTFIYKLMNTFWPLKQALAAINMANKYFNLSSWIIKFNCYEKVYRFFTKSYYQGAQGPLFCALDENLDGSSGNFYWENFKVFQPTRARDADFCKKMWNESERIVDLKAEERILES